MKSYSNPPSNPQMANQLVKQFNALSQSKGPAGTWHFDLRYNPLEPGPCHVLILIQPSSGVIHVERLPVGLPSNESGIEFFPESGKEAAPEIARAILHVFVNKLNKTEGLGSPGLTTPAPSRLTTRDRDLAPAVGWEFKNMSVRPTDLYRVSVCTPTIDQLTNTRFEIAFKTMKTEAGYKGTDAAAIPTPESIGLWNFKRDPVLSDLLADLSPSLFKEHTEYLQLRHNNSPQPLKESPVDMRQELSYLISVLEEDPTSELVKADADDGDADATLDYALRLYVGLGCKRNRTLARVYAVKATRLPSGSDTVRATAHSVLVDWCVTSSRNDFRKKYMYAASHHANLAASHCRRLQAYLPAPPAVLSFMQGLFKREVKINPDLKVFFKDALWAIDERENQLKGGQEKMQAKKLKAPLRYRCAAVGCGVEANRGKMLSQCAGKCDADKKPSYCSKECQKGDWKNHKPYCHPGAECSVIDDGSTVSGDVEPVISSSGALQVPITLADGSTQIVSSSTLDAAGLKELRDLAQENLTSFGSMPRSLSISMNRM